MPAVHSYSSTALGDLISEGSHAGNVQSLATKLHVRYLDEYLRRIGAKRIVVEHEYTDRDYSEDYAAYYARCFEGYARTCRRLHFFSEIFTEEDVTRALDRDQGVADTIGKSYLGFVIVKPLPFTVIGRTCLVPYSEADRERFFPCNQTISANLWGLKLTTQRKSLPFQEQDADVAACATSALWSIFRSTSQLFQHPAPSPAEITRMAGVHLNPGRSMPAAGLTIEQCATAIRAVGLEPMLATVGTVDIGKGVNPDIGGPVVATEYWPDRLKQHARAYLRAGVPALLLGTLIKPPDPALTPKSKPPKGKGKMSSPGQPAADSTFHGRHAISLLGYSEPPRAEPKPSGKTQTLFASSRIDRLYGHDDMLGPFARLDFADTKLGLRSSLADYEGKFFSPEALVFPVYHKIRVPLQQITRSITHLDWYIEELRQSGTIRGLDKRLIWDVFLADVQGYKSEILKNAAGPPRHRMLLLKANLPRFLWIARAMNGERMVFDLIYDATDLLQGTSFPAKADRKEIPGLAYNTMMCRAIGRALCETDAVNEMGRAIEQRVRMTKIARWLHETGSAEP